MMTEAANGSAPLLPEALEREFTLADVLALPEPQERFEKRTFHDREGRAWTITLKVTAHQSAEVYFAQAARLISGDDEERFWTRLGDGTMVEVSDPAYLSGLKMLSAITVSPPFNLDAWAIFGHKVGGALMNEIFAWAGEINRMGGKEMVEERETAKN